MREFSANVAEGIVIDQLPSASSLAEVPPKKRSLLWLWILIALLALAAAFLAYSALNRTLTVPNVVGMSQELAETTITDAGFDVGGISTTQTTNATEVGTVVAQTPAASAAAKANSAIDIVVSGGQKLVDVPDVVGMTEAAAQSALKSAGLTAQSSTGNSKTVPAGSVIQQAPPAGQQVPAGTSVGITISQGPGSATVPSVVGKSQSDAQSALKSAGLGSQVVNNYNAAPKGQVYAQTPSAGTLVAPGTVVAIQVSKGPAPTPTTVAVPDVIGQTQTAATSQLEGLGFKVQASQVATTGVGDQVVAQAPAGNTQAPQGSTVSIVVTKGP